jgi:hypothetical protein
MGKPVRRLGGRPPIEYIDRWDDYPVNWNILVAGGKENNTVHSTEFLISNFQFLNNFQWFNVQIFKQKVWKFENWKLKIVWELKIENWDFRAVRGHSPSSGERKGISLNFLNRAYARASLTFGTRNSNLKT